MLGPSGPRDGRQQEILNPPLWEGAGGTAADRGAAVAEALTGPAVNGGPHHAPPDSVMP